MMAVVGFFALLVVGCFIAAVGAFGFIASSMFASTHRSDFFGPVFIFVFGCVLVVSALYFSPFTITFDSTERAAAAGKGA